MRRGRKREGTIPGGAQKSSSSPPPISLERERKNLGFFFCAHIREGKRGVVVAVASCQRRKVGN